MTDGYGRSAARVNFFRYFEESFASLEKKQGQGCPTDASRADDRRGSKKNNSQRIRTSDLVVCSVLLYQLGYLSSLLFIYFFSLIRVNCLEWSVTYQPTDQPTDQPTNQPTNRPTDLQTHPLIEMPDASKNVFEDI